MTIKQRHTSSLAIFLFSFSLFFGVIFLGARSYDHLQKGSDLVDHQEQEWLTLNFQVSQYLKTGLEAVLSGKKVKDEDFTATADEIVHTFIQLEKGARGKQSYLTYDEQQDEKSRLIQVRNIFGLIHAELEKTVSLLNQKKQKAAFLLIDDLITTQKLDTKFIELINQSIQNEKDHASHLDSGKEKLKKKLIAVGCSVFFISLLLVGFLMSSINRSVQKSIEFARNQLLKGTELIGSGNLDTQIEIQTKDELSVVAEAFNQMTKDLKEAWHLIGQQQQQIVVSSKMSALGEMAGGIAHEINNPLAIISSLSAKLHRLIEKENTPKLELQTVADKIETTTMRIAKIIHGLRTFSRDGSHDPFEPVLVSKLLEETLSFCSERFRSHAIELRQEAVSPTLMFEGRSVEISQVLLNLLNNSHDAIEGLSEKWISVKVLEKGDYIEFEVTDSGKGISPETQKKLFQPFFTTKEVGKGTGLGLSVSLGIIANHKGELTLDTIRPNTCFVIRVPKAQPRAKRSELKNLPGIQ